MTTKANRQRRRKPEMQADDVYVPSSIRKEARGSRFDAVNAGDVWHPSALPDGVKPTDKLLVNKSDPLGDLCGEPFHPVAIYLTAAAIAFAGGLGLGWAVWA